MDKISLASELELSDGIAFADAIRFIDTMTATITKELKKGRKVCTDLGNFYIIHKNARVGTNPRTSALITIKAKNTVILRASKDLKAALNG